MPVSFIKMHGLGNDFVILDSRLNGFTPTPDQIKRIADRNRGVGCDQVIVLGPAPNKNADVNMGIFNADGSTAGACGNATRCVADLEMNARAVNNVAIQSPYDVLQAHRNSTLITVDMGIAQTEWNSIPLSKHIDTLSIDVAIKGLPPAVAVNMGNPHAVFFVSDVEKMDIATFGKQVEHHSLFPARTNVEFVEVKSRTQMRMRVWERGAGITQACGSGACAVMVAAVRRGLTDRKADIILDGGVLSMEWLDNGHVLMTGPVATSFTGELSDDLLNGT
ncbi:MAG: diaminopimelate epimerase [Alphaproteobacteria bacterium]|nr:diaminopimelate epimerase [Alphaproteobacteria bacterium]